MPNFHKFLNAISRLFLLLKLPNKFQLQHYKLEILSVNSKKKVEWFKGLMITGGSLSSFYIPFFDDSTADRRPSHGIYLAVTLTLRNFGLPCKEVVQKLIRFCQSHTTFDSLLSDTTLVRHSTLSTTVSFLFPRWSSHTVSSLKVESWNFSCSFSFDCSKVEI